MRVCLSICLPSLARHTNLQGHTVVHAYSVIRVVENGVEVRPVDKPHSTLVVLKWVYRCPEEMPNAFWPQKDALASSLGPTIAP